MDIRNMHVLDHLKQDDIFIQVTAIVVSFNAAAGLVSVGVKSVKMSAYLLYRREILFLARRHERGNRIFVELLRS